jgi:hypothetical protein
MRSHHPSRAVSSGRRLPFGYLGIVDDVVDRATRCPGSISVSPLEDGASEEGRPDPLNAQIRSGTTKFVQN